MTNPGPTNDFDFARLDRAADGPWRLHFTRSASATSRDGVAGAHRARASGGVVPH